MRALGYVEGRHPELHESSFFYFFSVGMLRVMLVVTWQVCWPVVFHGRSNRRLYKVSVDWVV